MSIQSADKNQLYAVLQVLKKYNLKVSNNLYFIQIIFTLIPSTGHRRNT
jgi:hypothetical protein